MCNDDKIIADFGAEDYNNWCIEKIKEEYNVIKEDYNEIKEDYKELKESNEKLKEESYDLGKNQNKKETAIKMLNMNMTYDVISEVVGLSIEEIKKLENNK